MGFGAVHSRMAAPTPLKSGRATARAQTQDQGRNPTVPRFAANLSLLFDDAALDRRVARAAECGFKAVEIQFPYDTPAASLAGALEHHGVELVLMNLPAGDWAGGDRGIAALPERRTEFREGIDRAIDYARRVGCRHLNCLAGIPGPATGANDAWECLAENLDLAARRLYAHGMTLLVEPINSKDVPGFFLDRTEQAADIIRQVGAPNLGLQLDLYHRQRMQGDLAAAIEDNIALIRHIQIADNPGRHEPGTGEINYPFLFSLLDSLGYDGWIGAEYVPMTDAESGLSWCRNRL